MNFLFAFLSIFMCYNIFPFFCMCINFKSFMQTFMVLSENVFALKIRIIFICTVWAFFYDILEIKNKKNIDSKSFYNIFPNTSLYYVSVNKSVLLWIFFSMWVIKIF